MFLHPKQLISIAVISIGIASSAGCGNNSRDTVRSGDLNLGSEVSNPATVSTPAQETTAIVMSKAKNPTAGELHEILKPAGYLLDSYKDNLAWKNRDEAIYFQVYGSGNGQFERQIRRLTMFKAGKTIWSSVNVQIKGYEIYIQNTKQQWKQVFDGKLFSLDQIDEGIPLNHRDAAMKAFRQRRAAYLSKVAREGLTPEIEAEALVLQRERDILLQQYFQKENVRVVVPQRNLRSAAAQDHLQSKKAVDIDSWVDEQVEKHWRPLPGGNSKEDAKRISKDVLKAKTWEELEQVMKYHHSKGR